MLKGTFALSPLFRVCASSTLCPLPLYNNFWVGAESKCPPVRAKKGMGVPLPHMVPPNLTPVDPVNGPPPLDCDAAAAALNCDGPREDRSAPLTSPANTRALMSDMESTTLDLLSTAREFMTLSRDPALYSYASPLSAY